MKHKVLFITLSLVACISITGCGEKKTVGDNLIHEDPTAYSSEAIDLSGMTGNNSIEDEEDAYQPENTEDNIEENIEENNKEAAEANSEDNMEESNGEEVAAEMATEENAEGETDALEQAESAEGEDASNEEASENAGDSENNEDSASDNQPVVSTDIMVIDNNIIEFSNISGQDIDKLYITFSAGNINNLEVLGVSDLKNGFGFKYGITDMASLKSAGIVTLSITAKSSKGEDMDFGSMEIIDVTDLSVVLSKNSDGYHMYLE